MNIKLPVKRLVRATPTPVCAAGEQGRDIKRWFTPIQKAPFLRDIIMTFGELPIGTRFVFTYVSYPLVCVKIGWGTYSFIPDKFNCKGRNEWMAENSDEVEIVEAMQYS